MGKYVNVSFVRGEPYDKDTTVTNEIVRLKPDGHRYFVRRSDRNKYEWVHIDEDKLNFVTSLKEVVKAAHIKDILKVSLVNMGILRVNRKLEKTGPLCNKFEVEQSDVIKRLKHLGIYNVSTEKGLEDGTYNFQYINDVFALTKAGWVQRYINGDSGNPSPINSRQRIDRRTHYVLFVDENDKPQYSKMITHMIEFVNRQKKRNTKCRQQK